MATTAQDTTTAPAARELVDPALPLAHSANTDAPGHWEAREAALVALRDAYQQEGWPVREAANLALVHLDSRLEAEAEALAFVITAWAAWQSGAAHRKAFARRDPRSPRMRAADRARVNLATGARVIFDGAAALVSSATRAGVVHRVEGGRCSCEALGCCWHVEAARQEYRVRKARQLERVSAVIATLKARRLAAA